MKQLSITVSGKVQGVYFRAHAQSQAQKLGLHGFARNEPDGSVYIEVAGEEKALEAFVAWCHQGSPEAVVEQVLHREQPVAGHQGFTTF